MFFIPVILRHTTGTYKIDTDGHQTSSTTKFPKVMIFSKNIYHKTIILLNILQIIILKVNFLKYHKHSCKMYNDPVSLLKMHIKLFFEI